MKHWIFLLAFLFLFRPDNAHAYAFQDSYIPPELASISDFRQRVTIFEHFEVNGMSWQELQAVPGINEDIALKILRYRPFSDIQDFYKRMPGATSKPLNRWMQQLQPKLRF
ncbi:MAG TPA: helix-hairpin-helix domain-containing protein [Oculatellaceae cyanobacterium]|jgi:DNA uptake protein ComE-like DNA-binding protein